VSADLSKCSPATRCESGALADLNGVDIQGISGFGGKAGEKQHQEMFPLSSQRRSQVNADAQFCNGLMSEFALGVVIQVSELISEGTWHFCRKKETGVMDFIGD
jgi:hypothetical protein